MFRRQCVDHGNVRGRRDVCRPDSVRLFPGHYWSGRIAAVVRPVLQNVNGNFGVPVHRERHVWPRSVRLRLLRRRRRSIRLWRGTAARLSSRRRCSASPPTTRSFLRRHRRRIRPETNAENVFLPPLGRQRSRPAPPRQRSRSSYCAFVSGRSGARTRRRQRGVVRSQLERRQLLELSARSKRGWRGSMGFA